jgi:hypothetical protein
MSADMPDASDAARTSRLGQQRSNHRSEFAGGMQIQIDAMQIASTAHRQSSFGPLAVGAHLGED